MKPMKRKPVNKYKSAKRFKRDVGRSAKANIVNPMRGGWRF